MMNMPPNRILYIDKNRVITVQILNRRLIVHILPLSADPAEALPSMCVSALRAGKKSAPK